MEKLYTLKEVPALATCSYATVMAAVRDGRLKATKQTILGNSWHWVCTAEQIEEFSLGIKRRGGSWGPRKPRLTPVEKVLAYAAELGVPVTVMDPVAQLMAREEVQELLRAGVDPVLAEQSIRRWWESTGKWLTGGEPTCTCGLFGGCQNCQDQPVPATAPGGWAARHPRMSARVAAMSCGHVVMGTCPRCGGDQ